MREMLKNKGLTAEEVNLVEVFMLLYGYSSLEELLSKTTKELEEHKDWDEEVASCIEKIQRI